MCAFIEFLHFTKYYNMIRILHSSLCCNSKASTDSKSAKVLIDGNQLHCLQSAHFLHSFKVLRDIEWKWKVSSVSVANYALFNWKSKLGKKYKNFAAELFLNYLHQIEIHISFNSHVLTENFKSTLILLWLRSSFHVHICFCIIVCYFIFSYDFITLTDTLCTRSW